MTRLKLSFVFLLLLTGPVAAALNFPTLTGRVVDNAHILSSTTIQSLDQSLAAYEKSTSNQFVVVTVNSLQGVSIEQYGYQLGRAWGIGQKAKNNGVLLIVAPKERKVRIEVGYGLEDVLTDALCSAIIQGIILPDFRAGQMEKGIVDGVAAIIGGKTLPNTPDLTKSQQQPNDFIGVLFFLIILFVIFISRFLAPFGLYSLGTRGGWAGGSSGFGGGFSGGGGSFGGGGASGGW